MLRFISTHRDGLIIATGFFVAGTLLSLHLSAAADRRMLAEHAFQARWKDQEAAWLDSNMAQSARSDSFHRAVIDSLKAMRLLIEER